MKNCAVLWVAAVSFPLAAQGNINTIKPTAFIALKKGSEQYTGVCNAAANRCGEETKVWKAKGLEDVFYLTDPTLEMIKIRKKDGGYIIEGQWKIANKNNDENAVNEDLTKDKVYIYPALYPLSKTKQAIALVTKWQALYSGGSREEEYADFIMLNDDGSSQVAFKDVLFSSKAMIRACFTAEEYAKTSHCHDEDWALLNLKFIDEGKEYYSWKFITKSYTWPAFVEKASTQPKITERVAWPFQ